MTAELVRGQNHPVPGTRVGIQVTAERPVITAIVLGGERELPPDTGGVLHPAVESLEGVQVPPGAAPGHQLDLDLEALPGTVHRVGVLLALPADGGSRTFGSLAPPSVTATGPDGTTAVRYALAGLTDESAVVALEFYRRQDTWKVRAIGQGYAGGLAALLADHGLADAALLAVAIHDAAVAGLDRTGADAASLVDGTGPVGGTSGPVSYRHPRRSGASPGGTGGVAAVPADGGRVPEEPVAGDAAGWSMEERLYNQVWGMFEDAARSVAAYRSAVGFAESRRERELDTVLSDPRARLGPAADAARASAEEKHTQLVDQARGVLDRDLDQLLAESAVVEPALPPPFAGWDNPVWHAYQVPMEVPMALRLGDLALPEIPGLRIPMLVRLPLERGLWVDCGSGAYAAEGLTDPSELRRLGVETAVAIAARLVASYPVDHFALHVIDPAGTAATTLAPLLESGALPVPPAVGASDVTQVLHSLTERVELVQMAVRGGATASLPPEVDTAEQLLLVHDFPHGFDDRAINQLRYLADEGPPVGVHLLMVADREDTRAYGPLLDPLWRSLLRVTPVPDDHLADPWVGHSWTYSPPLVPGGSQVLSQVLGQVATARRSYGRRPQGR